MSGAMRPGEHIKEAQLSEELGVSRGTLREAIRSVETEGLVENDGRGHMLVRKLSAQQIAEVFEVRTALETLAACRLAQSPRRDEHADRLEEALRPLQRTDLDFAERIETDLGFHALLCQLTGNETLVGSWSHLIGQIRMTIIAAGEERAAGRMRYEEHVPIADAIRTGDVRTVRKTMASHMADFSQLYAGEAEARETSEGSARPA